jgi:hypothetical protein
MPRSLIELLMAIRAAKRADKGGGKCENGENEENGENGENGEKEGGSSATTATLTASVVEIYNDVIVDLLSPRPSSSSSVLRGSRTASSSSSSSSSSVSSLQVCMGKDGTVSVPGLTHCELPLDDARAGWSIIEEGMARR